MVQNQFMTGLSLGYLPAMGLAGCQCECIHTVIQACMANMTDMRGDNAERP